MKITIQKKRSSAYSLIPKDITYKNIKEVFEVSDSSVEKMLCVIDEIIERSFVRKKGSEAEDLKNNEQTISFPLFPYPFLQTTRFLENNILEAKENNNWLDYWSTIPLRDIIYERKKILEDLNRFEMAWFGEDLDLISENIPDNAVISLEIDRKKLRDLRKKLERNHSKIKKIKLKNKEQKTLTDIELDESRKVLILFLLNGKKEEIGFRSKKTKKENSKFIINPERLADYENLDSETNFFKAFASYFDMKKVVSKFSDKEPLDKAISIESLAHILKVSIGATRGYNKRIREFIENNGLPMKLSTDNKKNYQLLVKLTEKIGNNE